MFVMNAAQRQRILLIEDDAVFAEECSQLLCGFGYEVRITSPTTPAPRLLRMTWITTLPFWNTQSQQGFQQRARTSCPRSMAWRGEMRRRARLR